MELEKLAGRFLAIVASRRGRIVILLTLASVSFLLFFGHPSDSYQRLLPGHAESDVDATSAKASSIQSTDVSAIHDDTDWSRFAYSLYVTNNAYLCNALMVFETLHNLSSRADRILMYPTWMMRDPAATENHGSYDVELLIKARDQYNVKLVQVEVQHKNTADDTWADSYTKLLVFNQTQYDRIISLDADITVLQHMDELFHMPPCPVAMPRAYWLLDDNPPKKILASYVMLIQPSKREFQRIQEAISSAGANEYDMDILNKLYVDTAVVLPHRPYSMLTAEFRMKNHSRYLGSDREEWNPKAIYEEAKSVHFSDHPVPKPWVRLDKHSRQTLENMSPECTIKGDGKEDCTAREIWRHLYADFAKRKAITCASNIAMPDPKSLLSFPADEWEGDSPIE